MTANDDTDTEDRLLVEYLPVLLNSINSDWPVLSSGLWNASAVRSVLRHLNELGRKSRQTGLVNIYEFTQVIDKAINDIHEENTQPDADEIEGLNKLLDKLQQAVADSQSTYEEAVDVAASYDVIYLQQPSIRDQIPHAIEKNGWQVLCLDNVKALTEAVAGGEAKVLLMDAEYLQHIGVINQFLDDLRSQNKTRPELFFLSNHCDIEFRLEALRMGATQCFSKPINITDLMSNLKQIITPEVNPHYRILIVEDDESQANFASALLRKGGFETLSISDPLSVMEAVEQFQPDLILMDLYMPGANGIELTQLIRERDESLTIPIVFLSGEDDLDKKLLALHSGADDFLTKPVRPQHLLATVKTRINRARAIFNSGSKGHIDFNTGLHNRRELLEQLDLGNQEMQNGDAVIALFCITLADSDQQLRGDQSEVFNSHVLNVAVLLRALFRKRDIIARIAGHSLGILIQRKEQTEIEDLGASLYEQLKDTLPRNPESGEGGFGIGLEMINADQLDGYQHLSRVEAASLQAFLGEYNGILQFQDEIETVISNEQPTEDFQKQQFLNALNVGLIEFHEYQFNASLISGNEIKEQIPVPAPATDIVLISNDIYLTADRYGLSDKFDKYICHNAIKKLGDLVLNGYTTQLIIRLSANAMNDDTLIEFLKSELRSMQLVGTGLIIELNLPSLASNLKQARRVLGELSSMGISTLLGNFACNETAYKVLAYLKADGVRPHISMMKASNEKIHEIATQVHSLRGKIILPRVEKFGSISLHWSEVADYVQADYDN
jgi:DNA-binding response OmpR family regulator/EAL domain-containing protein (putative c-di-GMP-specific phosphodiesterase class I)